jgi:hypothetical protein
MVPSADSHPGRSPAPRNPFLIGVHAEGEHFCNRETEVDRIAAAFRDPGVRLLVYGDRRLGKSSALRVAATRVRAEGHPVAVVDLAKASSAAAAAQRILAAVHDAVGRRWRDTATALLHRLRPGTFTVTGSLDAAGQPSVAFQLTPAVADDDPAVVTDVLDAVDAELGARGVTLGLALDEFQRLGVWYGADVDWQLKELLERHRHVGYVLAGSQRRLVEQMLANKRAGLWKVVDVLAMPPIAPARLAGWLEARAAAAGVLFERGLAEAIVALAGPRTRDVVQLARAVWDRERGAGWAVPGAEADALEALVREQSALYQREWDRLAQRAKRLLEVLAAAPDVRQLLSDETLKSYRLGAKSTVQSALKQLVEDELLVRTPDSPAGYAFDDPFFRRWVQVHAAANLGRVAPPIGVGPAPAPEGPPTPEAPRTEG